MSKNKPVVLIPSNILENNGLPGHFVRDTYVQALLDIAGCIPLLMPVTHGKFDIDSVADRIDGILLTGSPSNVCPNHYGAERVFDEKLLDLARDATTLPLIRRAIDADIPLIAICRGFQELNVAMGGSLHQKIQELPGKHDHREPQSTNLKIVYETAAHKVKAEKGGLFEKIGLPAEFDVNSLHQQGVDRLGSGLFVEAISDDGIIEAVSIPDKRFILGVQWHPEGDHYQNPTSQAIFKAYGDAVRTAQGNGALRSLKSGT
jgi:putative glutamine amidotransferase